MTWHRPRVDKKKDDNNNEPVQQVKDDAHGLDVLHRDEEDVDDDAEREERREVGDPAKHVDQHWQLQRLSRQRRSTKRRRRQTMTWTSAADLNERAQGDLRHGKRHLRRR